MIVLAYPILLALVYYIINYYRWARIYPKGPTPYPLLGNLFQLNPHAIYNDLATYGKKFGSVFTVFTPRPMVVLSDYEAIKEAFVSKADDFSQRPQQRFFELLSPTKDGGVAAANGQSWQVRRRTAIGALRDLGMGRNIMEEKIKISVLDYLAHLEELISEDGIDFRWPIQYVVSDFINEVMFGYRYDRKNCQEFMNFIDFLTNGTTRLLESPLYFIADQFPWVDKLPLIGYYSYGSIRKDMEKSHAFARKSLERALDGYDPETEPNCFVQAFKQKIVSTKQTELNEEQLLYICIDFFFAAQDTTTTTLRWAMIHLAEKQHIQDKLRSEILSVVGTSRLPSISDKPNLPYLSATIYEILRTANILALNLPHEATVDTEVMGHKIPAKTYINADLHNVLAHDPHYKQPDQFSPERFLNADGRTLNKEAVDRCIAFSMGRRQCAGESLARMEIFLIVAATIQKYRLSVPEGVTFDHTPVSFFALHPNKNIRIIVRPVA